MTHIVITMKEYKNSEAVSVYDIKLGIRWRHAISFKFLFLPLRKEPPTPSNIWLDGRHTFNGDNIPMHGDQQVKLKTLI